MLSSEKQPIFLSASTFRHIADFEGLAAAINAVPVFAKEAWFGRDLYLGCADECSTRATGQDSRRFVARMPGLEFCYEYAPLNGRSEDSRREGTCFQSVVMAYGASQRKALKNLFEGILNPWLLFKYVERRERELGHAPLRLSNPIVSIGRGAHPIIFTPQIPKAVRRFQRDNVYILR
ncbi:MAG: hypothetical protein AB7S81_06790 [Bdellovibrionales bacterium]